MYGGMQINYHTVNHIEAIEHCEIKHVESHTKAMFLVNFKVFSR